MKRDLVTIGAVLVFLLGAFAAASRAAELHPAPGVITCGNQDPDCSSSCTSMLKSDWIEMERRDSISVLLDFSGCQDIDGVLLFGYIWAKDGAREWTRTTYIDISVVNLETGEEFASSTGHLFADGMVGRAVATFTLGNARFLNKVVTKRVRIRAMAGARSVAEHPSR